MKYLLNKKVDGSFTVEASLIVPAAIFLIIAVFYLFFYQHDRILLQSYAYDAGETLLFAEDGKSTDQSDVRRRLIMMKITDFSESSEGSIITRKLLELLSSWKETTVQLSGQLSISIPGTAALTGSELTADVGGTSVRVSYVDDWMKKHVLVR